MASGTLNILLKYRNESAGLNQAVSGINKLLVQAGALATAYFGVHAAASGLRDIVKTGAELEDQSRRTGASVRDLAIMKQVFKDTGIEADKYVSSLSKMQKSLAAASKGDSSDFRNIGLSIDELMAMKPAEQFDAIAAAIAKIENPAKRAAAAAAIFGKGGAELLQAFEPGAIEDAKRSLGSLPDILERNAQSLERSDKLMDRLPMKLQQFWAGVADQLIDTAKGPQEELDKLDLTGVGQKVGAYLALVIQSFKDGRLGEFLSLSLQAGFEEALDVIRSGWNTFCSQDFQAPVWSAIISLGVGIYTTLVGAAAKVVAYLAAGYQWIGANIAHWIGSKIEAVIGMAKVALLVATGAPATVVAAQQKQNTDDAAARENEHVTTLPEAVDQQSEYWGEGVSTMTAWLNERKNATLAIISGTAATDADTESVNSNNDARKKLAALEAAQIAKTNAAKDTTAASTAGLKGEAEAVSELSAEEREVIQLRIEGLRFERQQLLTMAQKRRLTAEERSRLSELAAQEKAELQILIDYYERVASSAMYSAVERAKAANMVAQLQLTQKSVGAGDESAFKSKYQASQERFSSRGNEQDSYQTAGQGFESGITDYISQIGTLGDQLYSMTQNVASGFSSSVGGALTGLIMKTTTWKDAVNSVFTSVLSSGVNAFVQLETQQLMLKLHTLLYGQALNKTEVADKVATETAKTATEGAGASARVGIKVGETAADATNQGVQVAAHGAAETAMTGETFLGALARGAVRVGETIFAIGQFFARLAIFTVTEIAMTAITIAQMALRLPMIIAESIAYVIKAAVGALSALSAIPVVGPILGLMAMGTVFAAGIGMIGKSANGTVVDGRAGMMVRGIGGPKSDLNPYLLSDREGVLNAAAVESIGEDTVHYINRNHQLPPQKFATGGVAGGGASGSGASGSGAASGGFMTEAQVQDLVKKLTVNVALVDDKRRVARMVENDPQHGRWVIREVKDNKMELL